MKKFAIPAKIIFEGGFVVEAIDESQALKVLTRDLAIRLDLESYCNRGGLKWNFEKNFKMDAGKVEQVDSDVEALRHFNKSFVDSIKEKANKKFEIRAVYREGDERKIPEYYEVFIDGVKKNHFAHDPYEGIEGAMGAEEYIEGWVDSKGEENYSVIHTNYTFCICKNTYGDIFDTLSGIDTFVEPVQLRDLLNEGLTIEEAKIRIENNDYIRCFRKGL